MTRSPAAAILALILGLAPPAPAVADDSGDTGARPDAPARVSAGGGVGYPQIFSGDVSVWLFRQASVDARAWSQALVPTKGLEGSATIHVGRGRWAGLINGGGGIWQYLPDDGMVFQRDPEREWYWRAGAGVGWLANAVDLRVLAGVTSRPEGHSVTLHVTIMRRIPQRNGSR